jgi:F-box/leucine-rich repeat protein 2/20
MNISGYFYNITDEGIRAVANGLAQLQSLDISGCRNITDEGIRALATGCTQLQSLDISVCDNITDEGRVSAERINCRK